MPKKTVAQLVADDWTALAIRRSKERIAALEAENERLREKLVIVAGHLHERAGHLEKRPSPAEDGRLLREIADAARAALKERI